MFFAIFANFQIFKLLVEYEDTCAPEIYFQIVTDGKVHILYKNGYVARVHSMFC